MLIHRPVLHFIQGIELALEHDEVSSCLTLEIDHTLLELLESINNFQEIPLFEEELVVTLVDS